jgi:hypothetical protein
MSNAFLFFAFATIFFSSCKKENPDNNTPAEKKWNHIELTSSGSLIPVSLLADNSGYWILANEDVGAGTYKVLLIKTDFGGTEISRKAYAGSGDIYAFGMRRNTVGEFFISCREITGGNSDAIIIKADAAATQFTFFKFDYGTNDRTDDFLIGTDGNYYATGRTNGFSSNNDDDLMLVKFKPDATVLWTKNLGGTDGDAGLRITQTNDGNILVLGHTYSASAGDRDFYISKWNTDGDTLWTKTFGSSGYEEAQDLLELNDGSLLFLGHTNGFGHPEHNLYAFKTDADGNMITEKNYGGSEHDGGQKFFSKAENEIYAIGFSSSFNSYSQPYLLQFDNALNTVSDSIVKYDGELESYDLLVGNNETAILSILIKQSEPSALLLSICK